MIHIAYSFDKNYRSYFGAAVTSLLLNSLSPKNEIHIHILTDEVDAEFDGKLNSLRQVFGVGIQTYVPTQAQLKRFSAVPLFAHVPVTTYFRLLLPELIPAGIDRLLYIDADTIVLDDIAKLYHHELDGHTLAGVLDRYDTKLSAQLSLKHYINSGVMLIDVQAWLQADCTGHCIAFAREQPQKIIYADQCAMNQVMQQDIALLAPRWNQPITHKSTEADAEGAGILHFITANKPWQDWYESPVGKRYWQYLDVSPWRGEKPMQPRTYVEAWCYARKLKNTGRLLECLEVYESILQSLAKSNRLI